MININWKQNPPNTPDTYVIASSNYGGLVGELELAHWDGKEWLNVAPDFILAYASVQELEQAIPAMPEPAWLAGEPTINSIADLYLLNIRTTDGVEKMHFAAWSGESWSWHVPEPGSTIIHHIRFVDFAPRLAINWPVEIAELPECTMTQEEISDWEECKPDDLQ